MSSLIKRIFRQWTALIARHSVWTVLILVALTVFSATYAVYNLGVNTDTADMLSEDLPFRKNQEQFRNQFPQFNDTLLIVVDARTPELGRMASERLVEKLKKRDAIFEEIYYPKGEPFFQKYGLLMQSTEQVKSFYENLLSMEPFLNKIAQDPTLIGLFSMLDRAISRSDSNEFQLSESPELDLSEFKDLFSKLNRAFISLRQETFYQLSWQELISGKSATESQRRQLISIKPHLDFSGLPGQRAIETVRSIIRSDADFPREGVRIRITGDLALSYDELNHAIDSSIIAGGLSIVTVLILLWFSLGSVALIVSSIITLLVGLTWTTAFSAFAIGDLNMISLAFAVLYIGLGIDYSIHYCYRYRELCSHGQTTFDALLETSSEVGTSLAICTATTSLGFYAFIPTSYDGISELGLIGGTGMFISFFVTLTLLPALLVLWPHGTFEPEGVGTIVPRLEQIIARIPYRFSGMIVTLTLIVALGAVWFLPGVQFTLNPMNLRDSESESVSAFHDLTDGQSSPNRINLTTTNRPEVDQLTRELTSKSAVKTAHSVFDLIPNNQAEKLRYIRNLSEGLQPEFWTIQPVTQVHDNSARKTIEEFHTSLKERLDISDSAVSGFQQAKALFENVAKFLNATEGTSAQELQSKLNTLQWSTLSALPVNLELLAESLTVQNSVSMERLPESLIRRWVAPGPIYRIEVLPENKLLDNARIRKFVNQVVEVHSKASGAPITYVNAGEAVVGAFQVAFMLALASMLVVLGILLRNILDVLAVIGPVLLAGLLTTAGTVFLNIPFNFANVIVLPLLLGIGVDNGIHILYRYRQGQSLSANLLETSTAKAVLVSSLTTTVSFGNLMVSSHLGMASMGSMLATGMLFILASTLIILPAFLSKRTEHRI